MKKYFESFSWQNLFYLCSFYSLIERNNEIVIKSKLLSVADWIFPFNLYPIQSQFIYLNLNLGITAGFLLLSLIPFRFAPFISLVLWAMMISLTNSMGVVTNSMHGFFLASLGMCWVLINGQYSQKTMFEFALAGAVSIYTASGVWKLRYLLKENDLIYALVHNLPFHMAYGLAENYSEQRAKILQIIFEYPLLSGTLWLSVIAAQTLLPLAIILVPKFRIWLLCFFVLFHFVSREIIGPGFKGQINLLLTFALALILSKAVHLVKNRSILN